MAAGDGLSGDVVGVVAPHRQHVVAAALPAALAPQDEKRHRELLAAVGAVVFQIDARAGAILVAGRPDRLGLLKQRKYSAKTSGSCAPGVRDRPSIWRKKNSASAPIIRSGNGAGWIRKNQW